MLVNLKVLGKARVVEMVQRVKQALHLLNLGDGGELLGPIGAGVIAGEMEGAGLAPGMDEVGG